ncbi:MAG: SH3 domain-containing protein [Clostridia bacterium]|nr:SH3 domain-containing protein [Clostridia bacterium]
MKTKTLISLVLLVALVAGSMTALASYPGEYLGMLQVVNCKNWVTLRSYASTSASTVTRIPLGGWVEGYYYNTEFTECWYNGMHGYVLSTYLSHSGSSSSVAGYGGYMGKMMVVNVNEFVTLRSYPSTKASAVTRVSKGQIVDAYYYDSTWMHCYYNGMEGFILSKYLSGSYYGGYSASGSYLGAKQVVKCKEWVSLRATPSSSATRLAYVPLGAYVDAYTYDSRWYYCCYKGQYGYILAYYLK